jgi:hypothetical protein
MTVNTHEECSMTRRGTYICLRKERERPKDIALNARADRGSRQETCSPSFTLSTSSLIQLLFTFAHTQTHRTVRDSLLAHILRRYPKKMERGNVFLPSFPRP